MNIRVSKEDGPAATHVLYPTAQHNSSLKVSITLSISKPINLDREVCIEMF